MLSAFIKILAVLLFLQSVTINGNDSVKQLRDVKEDIQCLEDGKFYRNPKRPVHLQWTETECAKYFLCLDGEVYEFKCSTGLQFDVIRQICDFKQNVDNCDVTAEAKIPKPLLEAANCPRIDDLGCADGNCMPKEYFCDGTVDCADSSDEGHCTEFNDTVIVPSCNPSLCKLPDCFCSIDGTTTPMKINPNDIPQMIQITFDDAINNENWELINSMFFTDIRRNPNGCPIRGTFFVSHQFTNYHYVQSLWNKQHEIGIHSITHRGPPEWWARNATLEDWFDEMVGQANIINQFSNIRMEELRGLKVPFLHVGWNRQFLMMKEFGFVYDASLIAPFSAVPIWPYTMDFHMPHACNDINEHCPTRSYPGIWEIPINPLELGDYNCITIDACPIELSGRDVYSLLWNNFKRHFNTNRAPFGLHFHTDWFKNLDYLEAVLKFIDDVNKLQDVYFVTVQQTIEWIKNPTLTKDILKFQPWGCAARKLETSEVACRSSNRCKLYSRVLQEERFLETCSPCPEQYPWIRNEFGYA